MKLCLAILFIMISLNLFANEERPSQVEKEGEMIDFKSIKDVLKKDMIDVDAEKKANAIKKAQEDRLQREVGRYSFPMDGDFWTFMSELWLVKSATALKWDFEKPDYGLQESFKKFLEDLGYYEKGFKILLIDSPSITHMGLPSDANEFIFLLSVPFIRTLDLSKLEISLILFEDLIRLKQGYFKTYVLDPDVQKLFGTNFHEKKIDKLLLAKTLKKYDEISFDKGFPFDQQFQTTKMVGDLLKSDLRLWNTYLSLIRKIDDLTKANILYKDYSKIYPSPELQLGWLIPLPDKK